MTRWEASRHMAKQVHEVPPDSPNGRAATLNRLAAAGDNIDGLPERETQYVHWIRYIYRQHRHGRMCTDEAQKWQILMQMQFLQKPI